MLKDVAIFNEMHEGIKVFLGNPPPAALINIALAVYLFSCTVITLGNIANNKEPESKMNHLMYRTAFFFFYSFSAIGINFIPVLLIGLFLYILDYIHIFKMAPPEGVESS
jgi:hypothetical protein